MPVKRKFTDTCQVDAPGGFYFRETNDLINPVIENDTDITVDYVDANSSNTKLTNFFREKGDQPLTDIEYEGVISLLNKGRSISSPSQDRQSVLLVRESNRENFLRSVSGTPLKIPTFKPNFNDSASSETVKPKFPMNHTTRRIFNYAKLPSPYRTTIYKYSAAHPKFETNDTGVKGSETSSNATTPKKLSNTASALMSILDSNDSIKTHGNHLASKLANPYSPQVSHLRKHKKISPTYVETLPKSMDTTPLLHKPLSEVNNSTKAYNIDTDSYQTTSLQHKPNKSSLLKDTIELDDLSKKTFKVPQSSFNFSFVKPPDSHSQCVPSNSKQLFKFNHLENNELKKMQDKSSTNKLFDLKYCPIKSHVISNKKTDDITMDLKGNVVKISKLEMTKSTNIGLNKLPLEFEFGTLAPSFVDPTVIDDVKVEKYRKMFIF